MTALNPKFSVNCFDLAILELNETNTLTPSYSRTIDLCESALKVAAKTMTKLQSRFQLCNLKFFLTIAFSVYLLQPASDRKPFLCSFNYRMI
ncbi:CLUMA_CG006016, isoform A [Clunio marinus]|uniref:CLUMA_CG006016, isoform A n=1 Tax=Clunio marinus TaxID=568069 RepID=A0A1J1HWR1_9DIPT|nr:CLUMA_CG006016, isoform A [Clunio marinus]